MEIKEKLKILINFLKTINSSGYNVSNNTTIKGTSYGGETGVESHVNISGNANSVVGMKGELIIQPTIPVEIISELQKLLDQDLKEKSTWNKFLENIKTFGSIGLAIAEIIKIFY
jgi:hypothetical protein